MPENSIKFIGSLTYGLINMQSLSA